MPPKSAASASKPTKRKAPADSKRPGTSQLKSAVKRRKSSLLDRPSIPRWAQDLETRLPAAKPGEETLREYLLSVIHEQRPDYTPENDFDISHTLSCLEHGKELGGWREELDLQAKGDGFTGDRLEEGRSLFMKEASLMVDTAVNPIGRKPAPGEEDVLFVPLPESNLYIRIWGKGLAKYHQYCLDFVDAVTREPVNSTPDFELYAVPPMYAWWLPYPSGRFHSAEAGFGIKHDKIKPGAEKFILLEGSSWRLKRLGKQDVIFTIPSRQSPPALPDWALEATILEFKESE
ncbi:hypothetical protein OF83DRAFT_1170560 [Amylostereum chailletii]|nr:hypothetical protein OF83DRAFT_1170560 [Amylostereum chailletii]